VALSGDGMIIAIGAPLHDENGNNSGQVRVYEWDEAASNYKQFGQSINGESTRGHFGLSVSLSDDGKTLAIGAIPKDTNGESSGQVKVYGWDEAALEYKQLGQSINGEASHDRFGTSVSLSADGKTLAIGAHQKTNDEGPGYGYVKVYGWDEANLNYKQLGQSINGKAPNSWFGRSLALSADGETLAIGAPHNSRNGRNSGLVKVYVWDEAALTYKQLGQVISGEAAGEQFGLSVSLSRSGTTLAIGAPLNNANGEDSGQVKVYGWDEAALNYMQLGQSINGEAANDWFGTSVSLSGDGKTLAIGAPHSDGNVSSSGQTKVYGWVEDTLDYKQLGRTIYGEADGARCGWSVALNAGGNTLVIGAPHNDGNGAVNSSGNGNNLFTGETNKKSGHVKVYNAEY